MKQDEFDKLPNELYIDFLLLLNFSFRPVRTSCLSSLKYLASFLPGFIDDIFIPVFPKLNSEGKISVLELLNFLEFDINVDSFAPIIVRIIAEKTEKVQGSASLLLKKYFEIPNSLEYVTKIIDTLPPAKKERILAKLQTIISPQNILILEPTEEDKDERISSIPSNLIMKILSTADDGTDELVEFVSTYTQKYFGKDFSSNGKPEIHPAIEIFHTVLNDNFINFWYIFDIFLMWWANSILICEDQGDYDDLIMFLRDDLQLISTNNLILGKFELSAILPILVEFSDRNLELSKEIQKSLVQLSDATELFDVFIEFHELSKNDSF